MAVNVKGLFHAGFYGLATALSFSISPIFLRAAMAEGHSAEVGLAVGLIAATIAYALVLAVWEPSALMASVRAPGVPAAWELGAAVAIVIGTWLRYEAMATVPLAIVSAVMRVNILVILLLARRSVTPRVWAGGGLIIAGTVLLSF